MIKFYTNKELSQIFDINLARWKRWSREFLPPDPLGGLQSGYARQYNLDEAFTVFLGGHLVAALKFTIPEARQILFELRQWLLDHDLYFDFSGRANPRPQSVQPVQHYQIAIVNRDRTDNPQPSFHYRIKATITSATIEYQGVKMQQERYITSVLEGQDAESVGDRAESYRLVNISRLRSNFLDRFGE